VYLTYMSTESQERTGLQAGMAEKTTVVLTHNRLFDAIGERYKMAMIIANALLWPGSEISRMTIFRSFRRSSTSSR